MKKTLITAITLACAFALQAQTSPETIMSWCPALPSEADMIRFQAESAHEQTLTQPELFNDFADKLNVFVRCNLEKITSFLDFIFT